MTPRRMTQQRQALALICMLLLLPWRTHAAITCTAVTTRINTTVTCHFGVNIRQSKHNFNVQFYYPDLKAIPKTVLGCNFIEGGGLACHEGLGITFDRQISDHIQIIGPPAEDKVGGHYACQVLPALQDGQIKSCELTFKDIPTEPPTTRNPHHHQSETDDKDRDFVLLIVIVVLLVFILSVLFVYVILHWNPVRGRCKRSPITQDQETGDSQEEPQRTSSILSCFGNSRPRESGSDGAGQKTGFCCSCIKCTPEDKREETGQAKEKLALTKVPESDEKKE